MKSSEIKYCCFNSNRKFGIELEVEKNKTQQEILNAIKEVSKKDVQTSAGHWMQSVNNGEWHVKYDSSCGPKGNKAEDGGGWEIASFVASGYKDLLEIEKSVNAVNKLGCIINKHCGFHIHVDVSDFTKEEISILMARWIKIENWISQMVSPSRVNNKHCKLISSVKKKYINFDIKYEPLVLWDIVKPTNFAVHENPQKKVSLNSIGIAEKFYRLDNGIGISANSRQTIELRMPEGTLDGDNVKNWVRFFILFVETCKSSKMPNHLLPVKTIEEFLRFVGLSGSKNEFYLLSSGLLKTKKWALNKVKIYGSYGGKKQVIKKIKLITEPVSVNNANLVGSDVCSI